MKILRVEIDIKSNFDLDLAISGYKKLADFESDQHTILQEFLVNHLKNKRLEQDLGSSIVLLWNSSK